MRIGLLKKVFREKHASLSLSINAIVVLIMAITMLGLGLAFMRGVFNQANASMKGATADIEKQTIDSLKSSGKPVGVSSNSLSLAAKDNQGVIIAVTNTQDNSTSYNVSYNVLGCSGDIGATAANLGPGGKIDNSKIGATLVSTICTTQGSLATGNNLLENGALTITTVKNFGTILPNDAKTITFAAQTTSGVGSGSITIEVLVYRIVPASGATPATTILHGSETITVTTTSQN